MNRWWLLQRQQLVEKQIPSRSRTGDTGIESQVLAPHFRLSSPSLSGVTVAEWLGMIGN